MDLFGGIEPFWIWLTLGVILAGAEMLVSGVYLIWLAVAAIITGILTWLFGASVPVQIIQFVSISLIAIFSARRWLREKPIESSDPLMNRRGARLVGEFALVTHAIEGGSGRVHHGDSDWIARGVDTPVGSRVRITGSDGAILLVEPVQPLIGQGDAGAGAESGGDGGD